MSKELLFSKARSLAIPTFDISIWDNSLLLKVLYFLNLPARNPEQVLQAYTLLSQILEFPYQWDLHTVSASILESLNFNQINYNLHKIASNHSEMCKALADKLNNFGIPIVAAFEGLRVVPLYGLSCQIGTRVSITDSLDIYGHWFYGDNSFDYEGANRCYQIPSVGINPYSIRDELILFARSLSQHEANLINRVADSYLYNGGWEFTRNRLISYQVSYGDHVVGLAFYKPRGRQYGYVMYCNRANLPGNTNICYIGSTAEVNAFFDKFHRLWAAPSITLQQLVTQELDIPQKFQRNDLPTQIQKNLNCAYANPKSLVLASLYALMLENINDPQVALQNARHLYKRYTSFARVNCIYVLLNRYEYAQHDIERKMLQKIACKILLYYQRKCGWENLTPWVQYILNLLLNRMFGEGSAGLEALQKVLLLGAFEPYHRNNLVAKLRG